MVIESCVAAILLASRGARPSSPRPPFSAFATDSPGELRLCGVATVASPLLCRGTLACFERCVKKGRLESAFFFTPVGIPSYACRPRS